MVEKQGPVTCLPKGLSGAFQGRPFRSAQPAHPPCTRTTPPHIPRIPGTSHAHAPHMPAQSQKTTPKILFWGRLSPASQKASPQTPRTDPARPPHIPPFRDCSKSRSRLWNFDLVLLPLVLLKLLTWRDMATY